MCTITQVKVQEFVITPEHQWCSVTETFEDIDDVATFINVEKSAILDSYDWTICTVVFAMTSTCDEHGERLVLV